MSSARLQREMVQIFDAEAEQDPTVAEEARRLRAHYVDCGDNARSGVGTISEKSELFQGDCRQMNRFLCGLDITRVTCRIETRWIPDGVESFAGVLETLDTFHSAIESSLSRIDDLNQNISDRAVALLDRSRRRNVAKKHTENVRTTTEIPERKSA
jgi:hypothetical protein